MYFLIITTRLSALRQNPANTTLCPSQLSCLETHDVPCSSRVITGLKTNTWQLGVLIAMGRGGSLLSEGQASYVCIYAHTHMQRHTCTHIGRHINTHTYTHIYTYFRNYTFIPKPRNPNCSQRIFFLFPQPIPYLHVPSSQLHQHFL